MTNALMAIPNLIAVLGLSALIARETKHYVYDDNLDEIDETPIPIEETKQFHALIVGLSAIKPAARVGWQAFL